MQRHVGECLVEEMHDPKTAVGLWGANTSTVSSCRGIGNSINYDSGGQMGVSCKNQSDGFLEKIHKI